MAVVRLTELWEAFVRPTGTRAVVSKESGVVLINADKSIVDKRSERFIRIPERHDWNFGRSLVYQFVDDNMPDECARIREMFAAPGACARWRELLTTRGLLKQWIHFQRRNYEGILRSWARDNGFEVTD